ncbi:hypothetical protein K2X05_01610 [bacterium]|nr:hypothetical protein [bacterium]
MFFQKIKWIIAFAIAGAMLSACSSSSDGGGTTTAGQITNGMGSSVTTLQSLGTAMSSGTSSFAIIGQMRNRSSSVHAQSAANSCDENGGAGFDTNANGVIDSGERFNASANEYALQNFYCALAADSNGPETVSGAVGGIKMVVCAVERTLGSIVFDGVARSATAITIDRVCASQAEIDSMNEDNGVTTDGLASATLNIPITITAQLNPTFSEIASNTHYSHGIKIDGGSMLTYIVVAKFDTSSGSDPLDNGDFEFATYGTGEAAGGGSGSEITAGRIERTGATSGKLWYEFRSNRLKNTSNDPICPGTQTNCGWSKHIRLTGDITFSGDDVSSVSNFTGIIASGNDATGISGGSDSLSVITATGSLSTGITGKVWTGGSPLDLSSGNTVANLTAGTTTCIVSGGAITTSCGGGVPSPFSPTEDIKIFLTPGGSTGNNGTWFSNISTHNGLGYTGATNAADEQFKTP